MNKKVFPPFHLWDFIGFIAAGVVMTIVGGAIALTNIFTFLFLIGFIIMFIGIEFLFIARAYYRDVLK